MISTGGWSPCATNSSWFYVFFFLQHHRSFCTRQRHEIPQDTGMIRRFCRDLPSGTSPESWRRDPHSHIIIYHSILVSLPKWWRRRRSSRNLLNFYSSVFISSRGEWKEFKNDDDEYGEQSFLSIQVGREDWEITFFVLFGFGRSINHRPRWSFAQGCTGITPRSRVLNLHQ